MSISCHPSISRKREGVSADKGRLTIALAGNANVGKSVIFNQLTGSYQIIGNWPGKTVERAVGDLYFEGYHITVVDLPGIYSLSTFSIEEIISREYIAKEKPDVVVNVIDASVLERNLFFTLQLIEMEAPLIICLNQMDIAKKKGMIIDTGKLEELLGVPVVPTVAVKGEGIYELVESIVRVVENKYEVKRGRIRFSDELEKRIAKLVDLIEKEGLDLGYSSRFIAIKLLENDPEIRTLVLSKAEGIVKAADRFASEISEIYNDQPYSVIASERYLIINRIIREVLRHTRVEKTIYDWLDWVTTHRVLGYFTSAGILVGLLLWTFIVGDFLSSLFEEAFGFLQPVEPNISDSLIGVILNGLYGGLVAGVTLVIPYVIPFYLILSVIEDSGILTRIAFMLDSLMHKIGLHGKAIIPLILGYGCNVPAIYTSRIMETRRERLLAAFAISLIPCSARTIIILGLVSQFLGIKWALILYAADLLIVFFLGKIALKLVPGKTTGLIMEMHSFRVPSLRVVSRQTWIRTKSIIYLVFPIYMVGSAAVQALYVTGILDFISYAMAPLTVNWLGLPVVTGLLLIFGFIRKELILLLLVAIYGTTNLLLLSLIHI